MIEDWCNWYEMQLRCWSTFPLRMEWQESEPVFPIGEFVFPSKRYLILCWTFLTVDYYLSPVCISWRTSKGIHRGVKGTLRIELCHKVSSIASNLHEDSLLLLQPIHLPVQPLTPSCNRSALLCNGQGGSCRYGSLMASEWAVDRQMQFTSNTTSIWLLNPSAVVLCGQQRR